ncbi:hypothetical protein HNP92_000902 [Methanococcus maripaludis]|uniref:Phosphatidylinositol-specific phospholipase C X domain-containing protein n=1 Tax=Methanococcus maripaludis TaxID=39152 RepID=A0A7J9S465_METMI|nr:phosphatidylinositol-specific phospholipase C [Methanococcus maripaludis]MBB6401597.1 hypothetical protein [Methanococcus maripaludis]MBB6497783.1 hypothetical protein [Methanococcus maripaludis]
MEEKEVNLKNNKINSNPKISIENSGISEIPRGNNWMNFIPDNVKLSQMSIPGTHDSCAYQGGELAQTQDYNLKEQLENGIRFLDVRGRHIEDVITIHHGPIYLNQNLGDVLNRCYEFLNNNPSETILFSLKKEYEDSKNTESYYQTIMNKYYNSSKWYVGDDIPNLGDVRGKIVLLRRFSFEDGDKNNNAYPVFGINLQSGWKDDQTFSTPIAEVQDEYKIPEKILWDDVSEKLDAINTFFNKSIASHNYEKLYLNFSSGHMYLFDVIPIAGMRTIADEINPKISTFYENNKFVKDLSCIVIMDFPTIGNMEDIYWQSLRKHFPIYKIDVQILNEYQNEYMYAADYKPFDKDRRRVFTWRPGTKVNQGDWLLIPVAREDNCYYIYNTKQSEYLYAADYKPFDKDRRRVFTWRPGGIPTAGKWEIQFLDDTKTRCYIRNVYQNEYLYAADYKPFDKDRRRVFTWRPGTKVTQGVWKIIH